ncbi:hypothetical protein ACG3SL_16340 [Sphingomonas sp. CJ20]
MAEHADVQRKTLPRQAAQRHARAPLSALPATPALQRAARQLSGGKGVAQRSVLHKYDYDGNIVFYSDLEKGKRNYATREEAATKDAALAADPKNIRHALYRSNGDLRRANTPYSYADSVSVTAAPDTTRQGPHSLSFSSTEYRLQNRLAKGQHDEVAAQILAPDAFETLLAEMGPSIHITGKAADRMKLDYRSLHGEFSDMMADDAAPKTANSAFHLVARKLMQMHPATTYGINVKSKGNAERRKSRFGLKAMDKGALDHTDRNQLETFYNLRQNLFHSSDDETDGEDFAPFEYTAITPAKNVLGGIVHPKPSHDDEKDAEAIVKKIKVESVADDGGGTYDGDDKEKA